MLPCTASYPTPLLLQTRLPTGSYRAIIAQRHASLPLLSGSWSARRQGYSTSLLVSDDQLKGDVLGEQVGKGLHEVTAKFQTTPHDSMCSPVSLNGNLDAIAFQLNMQVKGIETLKDELAKISSVDAAESQPLKKLNTYIMSLRFLTGQLANSTSRKIEKLSMELPSRVGGLPPRFSSGEKRSLNYPHFYQVKRTRTKPMLSYHRPNRFAAPLEVRNSRRVPSLTQPFNSPQTITDNTTVKTPQTFPDPALACNHSATEDKPSSDHATALAPTAASPTQLFATTEAAKDKDKVEEETLLTLSRGCNISEAESPGSCKSAPPPSPAQSFTAPEKTAMDKCIMQQRTPSTPSLGCNSSETEIESPSDLTTAPAPTALSPCQSSTIRTAEATVEMVRTISTASPERRLFAAINRISEATTAYNTGTGEEFNPEDLPLLSYDKDPRGYRVLYVATTQEAEEAAALLKGPIMGMDAEWPHTSMRTKKEDKRNSVSLLQLCDTYGTIVLFHVEHMSPFPNKLREILEDRNILKFGSCISGDGSRIKNYPHSHWGVSADEPDTTNACPSAGSTAANDTSLQETSESTLNNVDMFPQLLLNFAEARLEMYEELSLSSLIKADTLQTVSVSVDAASESNEIVTTDHPQPEIAQIEVGRANEPPAREEKQPGESEKLTNLKEKGSPQIERRTMEHMETAHENTVEVNDEEQQAVAEGYQQEIKADEKQEEIVGSTSAAAKTEDDVNLDVEDRFASQINRKKGLIVTRSLVDLGSLAVQVADFSKHGNRPQQKLDTMANILLGYKLLKPLTTIVSEWNRPQLTDKQLLYAANDAYASLRLAEHIQLHQRKFPTVTGTVEIEKLRRGSGVLKRPYAESLSRVSLNSSGRASSRYVLRIKDTGEDWRIEEGTIDDWLQRKRTSNADSRPLAIKVPMKPENHRVPGKQAFVEV